MRGGTRSLAQLLNPLLTLLPLGVFASTVLFDYAAQTSGVHLFAEVAEGDMAAGVVVGTICLCTQLVDLLLAEPRSATRRVLGPVAVATSTMIMLFAFVWSVRADTDPIGSPALFVMEFVALAAGIAGAWFARGLVAGPPPEPDIDDLDADDLDADDLDSGYAEADVVRGEPSPVLPRLDDGFDARMLPGHAYAPDEVWVDAAGRALAWGNGSTVIMPTANAAAFVAALD